MEVGLVLVGIVEGGPVEVVTLEVGLVEISPGEVDPVEVKHNTESTFGTGRNKAFAPNFQFIFEIKGEQIAETGCGIARKKIFRAYLPSIAPAAAVLTPKTTNRASASLGLVFPFSGAFFHTGVEELGGSDMRPHMVAWDVVGG